MARLKGIMPSGKLGNVVFCTRNGRTYLRAKPKRVRQPKSDAQKAHWAAFGLMAKLSSDMSDAHKVGLAYMAKMDQQNTHSTFRHMNKAFVTAEGVDYDHLHVSLGRVAPANILSATLDKKGLLHVEFGSDPELSRCGSHRAYLFAYCPERHESAMNSSAKRKDGKVEMELPAKWKGHDVHLYLFMRDSRGRTSPNAHVKL